MSPPATTCTRPTRQSPMTIRPIAFALVVALGPARPAAGQQNVPFKGSLDGTIVAQNGNTFIADDTGQATHLGAFTAVQTYTFSSSTDFTGSIVFVAANG